MSDHDILNDFLILVKEHLSDLFQSGFGAANKSTVEELRQCEKLSKQYGMDTLSELLFDFLNRLEGERHQMKKDMGPLCILYGKLNQYLYLSISRLEVEKIRQRLKMEE